jgi:Altered inheritance of mitochondria protein 21
LITNHLIGTSPAIDGTPDEQVGYLASEEYASRITSPNPPSHHQSISNSSQTNSALRSKEEITNDAPLNRQSSESAVADEAEDEDVIHVDPLSPSRGDAGAEDLGLQGSNGSEHGGWIDEHSYGVPILASDEVAKEPAAEHLQPAVSPYQERRTNGYFTSGDLERSGSRSSSRPTSTPASRSGSRPSSIVGGIPGFTRYSLHDDYEELSTPLEDVEEYEPLFPEDEKGEKPKSPVDRLKRPELSATKSSSSSIRPQRRKFPSQDIWEDAPSSAQLQTTVTNPQLPDDDQGTAKDVGESVRPSSGASPVQQQEVEDGEDNSFLPQETRDWANPKYKDEINNSRQKQRFPSKDIWEDSPESLQLQTTVSAPQTDESKDTSDDAIQPTTEVADTQEKTGKVKGDEGPPIETKSALEKPPPPPRPLRSKEPTVGVAGVQPSIPTRPPYRIRNLPPADIPPMPARISVPVSSRPQARAVPPPPTRVDEDKSMLTPSPSEKKPPVLPERSKPQIPARPAKPVAKSGDSVSAGPAAKAVSAGSTEGSTTRSGPTPPAAKPKPAVPSRPNGGKLAAFKAGFFSDLDKRLQQGPTAPKLKPEPAEEQMTEEKAPLSDARKGRAKGPVRRKPAVSPSGTTEETTRQTSSQKFDISKTFTNWQIAEDGVVFVYPGPDDVPKAPAASLGEAGVDPTPIVVADMAGEKARSLENTATGPVNVKCHPDEIPDMARLAEDTEENPDLSGWVGTEGQSADSAASKRFVEKGQDQDTAFKTAIDSDPVVEVVAAADEPAASSRESAVEFKGVSTALEPIQADEHGVHTGAASTTEKHAATIGSKAPEEGNVVAKENAT